MLEREIHQGEVHTYPIELQAGQFLRVLVEEKGIKLKVRLFDGKGELAAGGDRLRTTTDDVTGDLATLAEGTGSYQLEITVEGKGSGRYLLRVEGPRAPTAADLLRAEAAQATWAVFKDGPKTQREEVTRRQIRQLERALGLWQEVQDGRWAAEVSYVLGLKRDSLADYGKAAEDFKRSATFWGALSDRAAKASQVRGLKSAGISFKHAGRPEEARRAYQDALAAARALSDEAQQASILTSLGLLETEEGERRGIDFGLEGLALARKVGERPTEARALNNLAYAYEQVADRQKALQYYQESLALARQSESPADVATALNNLADTYGSLGDWEKALDHYQEALKLNCANQDRLLEAKTLNNLGVAYSRLGRYDEAQDAFEQALSRGGTDLETQTFALGNQAYLLLRLKQPSSALATARQALILAQGRPGWEAHALNAVGSAHRELGDLQAARGEIERALVLARRRGDRIGEAEYSLGLARVEKQSGNLTEALSLIKPAIEIIESLRANVISKDLRASFLAAKQNYYELQTDILMSLHERQPDGGFAAEAFQSSERGRARNLLEILQEAGADIREGAAPDLVEREHHWSEEVNAREWHRLDLLAQEKPDEAKLAEAKRRLDEALDEHTGAQDQLLASSPRYAALTQPKPLGIAEVQRQVLDGETLLLEYALGEQRSYLWAVTSDSVASFTLPARDRIEETALRYYDRLTARNRKVPGEDVAVRKRRIQAADAEAGQAAHELSKMILQPVEGLLGNRPLLVVADGALQYIPFAALPRSSSGAPLAANHEIVSLPSASALAVMRHELRDRPPAPLALAIFADPVFDEGDERLLQGLAKANGAQPPDLPPLQRGISRGSERESAIDLSNLHRLFNSKKEAEDIAALVPPGEVFKALGFGASRAAVAGSGLDRYRNVHFATHGVIDSGRPELSKLVLSLYNERGERQDGFLRLNDIYNLRLNADLVVLSACRTALGKEVRGEGLIGLTRGFMYAGAARVLASLWSVDDRATAELMTSFYRGMLRDGLSAAAALRKAQLGMAEKGKSPYFWAGFSLQGEWR